MEKLNFKKAAVVGLGVEGNDLVNFLVKNNIAVTVYDQKPREVLDTSGIDIRKVNFVCGDNYLKNGFSDAEIIFRSPGVYRYIEEFKKPENEGREISSAIKLFFELCPAKIIGVTGTKGKGTTSTIIYQILKSSGKDVHLAGNIGKPCLELLPNLSKSSWVVLELSSFQLIDMTVSPHISVVLNITTDHLDWHKDRAEYIFAKSNTVAHQLKTDFAVINADYSDPLAFADKTSAKKYFFSRQKEVEGCYALNGKVVLNTRKKEVILNTNDLLLRGEHNYENITAAILASSLAEAKLDVAINTVLNFKGLEHRLELVSSTNRHSFYNDSFATGPQPSIAAIKSFVGPLTIILGGFDKGLDYGELIDEIKNRKQITNVILIGDIADKLEKDFVKLKFSENIYNLGKPSMDQIVGRAINVTPNGGVILLSPSAASFDMFKDYKQRGNLFKESVKKLINE